MTENEPIKTVSDGITFLSTGRYYDGINRWVAHKLKDGDNDAIAVSYTHLDVYKRQVPLPCIWFHNLLFWSEHLQVGSGV